MHDYDVIIAHGPGCIDGITAAWSFWRKLSDEQKDELNKHGGCYSNDNTYDSTIPYIHPNSLDGALKMQQNGCSVVFAFAQPGTEIPTELIKDKRVLILDLDMGDALVPVVEAASFVLMCDHHESSPLTINKHANFLLVENKHKFATYVVTEKKESGATLAWRLSNSPTIPPLVQVVRIGDTWSWNEFEHLHAKEVLMSLKLDEAFKSFPQIENTFQTWDENFDSYVNRGKSLIDHETFLVKQICKQSSLGFIQTNDGKVYTVAYVQANIFASEVGATMKWYAKKKFNCAIDFCATWKYVPFKNIIYISLRDPGTGVDLSHIARNIEGCKGGGHRCAAAFSVEGLTNLHDYIMHDNPITTNNDFVSS